MKPQVIMHLQLPVMAEFFTGRIRELAAQGGDIFWYEQARRLAFTVAARSALGSLLTVEQLGGALFEDFELMSRGAFSLVRIACEHTGRATGRGLWIGAPLCTTSLRA
jgi:hypothetical protein